MPGTPRARRAGLRSRWKLAALSDTEDEDRRPARPSSVDSRRASLGDEGDHGSDPTTPPIDEGPAATSGGILSDIARTFAEEIFQGYDMDSEASEVIEARAVRALKVPLELEKFLFLGLTLCLNCFLEFATYLPLRAAYAIAMFPLTVTRLREPSPGMVQDLLRCALIITSSYLHFKHVDVSQAYHWIRGELQSIIKLYVLFNVFDIVDKLFCSFGQDILDTLFYHASYKSRGVRWGFMCLLYFAFATAYVCMHSWLNLMQYVILNVAVNSANNALLTIVISNQFVELKGSVFKRSVLIRNMVAKRWEWAYFSDTLLPAVVLVFLSEVIVDNAKHVFVTRFNNLEPTIYHKFRRVLWKDVASSSTSQALSLKVIRRMGFTPLPLLSLFYIVLSTTVPITGPSGVGWSMVIQLFLGLLAFKVMLGIGLRRIVSTKVGRLQREVSPPCSEYAVRFPMEQPLRTIDSGISKKDVPLDQVHRFTMMSRIS